MKPTISYVLFLLTIFTTALSAQETELTDELEYKVKCRLWDSAYFSWELGTLTQVILEYDLPTLAVFAQGSIPPNLATLPTVNSTNTTSFYSNITTYNTTLLTPLYTLSQRIISSLVQGYGGYIPSDASQPLVIHDGSAGDPASLGVGILLFNWTGWGSEDVWGRAVENQVNYLIRNAPKTNEGAISHRSEEVQVWSDFVYMVPPLLAYYGALQSDYSLVYEGYRQIALYRSYLRDPDTHNLWKHILFGGRIAWDEGHWATGNGWAVLGMLRVAATIMHSEYADSMSDEVGDLVSWTLEIQEGMVRALDNSTFMFTNYLTIPPSPSDWNFYDGASCALFAYGVYVLSNLFNIHTYVPEADLVRKEISTSWSWEEDGEVKTGWKHFDEEGYLYPVVNPRSFGLEGEKSPEGQAFVVGMQAAYKEWQLKGSHMPPWRPVGTSAGMRCRGLERSLLLALVFLLYCAV